MRGRIILRNGSYTEMIMREQGSTRLISCFDFSEKPEKYTHRNYRLEYWEQGTLQRQAIVDLSQALAAFHSIAGEPVDPAAEKLGIMRLLTDRIDRGVCVHCGTSEQVLRALCAHCRTLPLFQPVLASA